MEYKLGKVLEGIVYKIEVKLKQNGRGWNDDKEVTQEEMKTLLEHIAEEIKPFIN